MDEPFSRDVADCIKKSLLELSNSRAAATSMTLFSKTSNATEVDVGLAELRRSRIATIILVAGLADSRYEAFHSFHGSANEGFFFWP